MKQIPLTQGLFAIVDDEDFERLNTYKWHVSSRGNISYAARKVMDKNIYMHREVLGSPNNMVVDHIDGNGLNNSRLNLRSCTQSENIKNSKLSKSNSVGFKGVSRSGTGYKAQICVNRNKMYLGYFGKAEEAAKAYDKAALEHFGEFANLNFPK